LSEYDYGYGPADPNDYGSAGYDPNDPALQAVIDRAVSNALVQNSYIQQQQQQQQAAWLAEQQRTNEVYNAAEKILLDDPAYAWSEEKGHRAGAYLQGEGSGWLNEKALTDPEDLAFTIARAAEVAEGMEREEKNRLAEAENDRFYKRLEGFARDNWSSRMAHGGSVHQIIEGDR
jgi:hypothetical protein